MTPLRCPIKSSARRAGQSGGFTMIELLIGVLISSIALVAGVKVLLEVIQGDNANQRILDNKSNVSLVQRMMEEEIRGAAQLLTGTNAVPIINTATDNTRNPFGSSACPTTTAKTLLLLRGITVSEDIAYAVDVRANNSWRGPAVLLRCGRPYNDAGSIDTNAGRREDVVLDNLQCSGFTATTSGTTSGTINRTVEISLNSDLSIANRAATCTNSVQAQTSTFRVPIASNQMYGAQEAGDTSSCATTSSGCLDPSGQSVYFRATGGETITGDGGIETIVYFNGLRSDYTIGGTGNRCTRDNCTVRLSSSTGGPTTITNGDVLIFRDIEIRL